MALSSLVGIPAVLPQLFDLLQLLLLLLQLFLLLFDLLLPFLFLPRVLFPLLLDGGVHVDELAVLLQRPRVLPLLLGDLLVQSLSVLLDRVFCVLVDGDLDDSVVADLLLLAVEILQVRMGQRLFHRQPVLRVKDQHFLEQVTKLFQTSSNLHDFFLNMVRRQ